MPAERPPDRTPGRSAPQVSTAATTRWQAWDAAAMTPGPWHTRHDHGDGSKSITWPPGTELEDLVYLAAGAWEALNRTACVVVTEGEKAADAVAAAGFLAAGTVSGASSTPGRAVLLLLARARIVLWPDADDVGRAHMARLGRRLEAEEGVRSLSIVRPPAGVPPGWDAADATRGQIVQLVDEALRRPVWMAA